MKSLIREEIQKFPDLPNDLKALFNQLPKAEDMEESNAKNTA